GVPYCVAFPTVCRSLLCAVPYSVVFPTPWRSLLPGVPFSVAFRGRVGLHKAPQRVFRTKDPGFHNTARPRCSMNYSDLRPERKLPRLPAAVYAMTGCEFFFTVCARHQGEPFRNETLAALVVKSLLWTRQRYHWRLFCYCLMPDHLHLVCALTDAEVKYLNAGARGLQPEGVLDHLGRFKSYTTTSSCKF